MTRRTRRSACGGAGAGPGRGSLARHSSPPVPLDPFLATPESPNLKPWQTLPCILLSSSPSHCQTARNAEDRAAEVPGTLSHALPFPSSVALPHRGLRGGSCPVTARSQTSLTLFPKYSSPVKVGNLSVLQEFLQVRQKLLIGVKPTTSPEGMGKEISAGSKDQVKLW